MKIKGLNTTSENTELLDSMYVGEYVDEDEEYIHSVADESTKQAIFEISEFFKLINADSGQFAETTANITFNEEGYAVLTEGMLLHNLPADRETLIERLSSIKNNGLLACEWFGIRYAKNEVPFRVSFHRVPQKELLSEHQFMGLTKNSTGRSGFAQNTEKCTLIVDGNHEVISALTLPDSIDFSKSDYSQKLVKAYDQIEVASTAYGNECAIRVLKYYQEAQYLINDLKNGRLENISKTSLANNISRILKNISLYDSHRINPEILANISHCSVDELQEVLFSLHIPSEEECSIIFESVSQKKKSEKQAELQSEAEFRDKYFKYIYAGVPSSLIIGIVLPESVQDKKLVEQIAKIFPQIPILSQEGKILFQEDPLMEKI